MLQLKMFDTRIDTVVWRFYLMMAVAIVVGYTTHIWWLAAVLAVGVAVSFILGISFTTVDKMKIEKRERTIRKLEHEREVQKAA